MLYMRLPKYRGFYFEVNLTEMDAETWADDWDAAYLCDGNQQGVIYNRYYDGVNELSAIYKTDAEIIDETTYKYYEVDWSDPYWRDKLLDNMIDAYKEFWK